MFLLPLRHTFIVNDNVIADLGKLNTDRSAIPRDPPVTKAYFIRSLRMNRVELDISDQLNVGISRFIFHDRTDNSPTFSYNE